MARTKALTKEENKDLQLLTQAVLDAHFGGHGAQTRFAKAANISQSTVSDLVRKGEGGGVASLRALAKYRPVEVVKLLGIEIATLVGLWSESNPQGVDMAELPDNLRRAARAAVELFGCSPDEAHQAAQAVLRDPADPDTRDAELWLMDIRPKLPSRQKSGVRRKV